MLQLKASLGIDYEQIIPKFGWWCVPIVLFCLVGKFVIAHWPRNFARPIWGKESSSSFVPFPVSG